MKLKRPSLSTALDLVMLALVLYQTWLMRFPPRPADVVAPPVPTAADAPAWWWPNMELVVSYWPILAMTLILVANFAVQRQTRRRLDLVGDVTQIRQERDLAIQERDGVTSELIQRTAELGEARETANVQQNAAIRERDAALEAEAKCSKEWAIASLHWFARRVRMNIDYHKLKTGQELPGIRVTVRFATYADYKLAHEIEKILIEHTQWPVKVTDKDVALIRPDARVKVMFESGLMGSFSDVAGAFVHGKLIPAVIGHRAADRGDDDHLVVEVIPEG